MVSKYVLYHNRLGYYQGSRRFSDKQEKAKMYRTQGHAVNAYHSLVKNHVYGKSFIAKDFTVFEFEMSCRGKLPLERVL